ncbi:hypothetical protein FACS1894137_05110 [Spirochaetia bacterium]|nr:hypothetical protein FACS1894137_05110 [Spirochaetia bacterium]
MSALISIILPAYNSEKYIKQCINSVLAQEYENFECLCINDGSTDSTVSILNEYTDKDKRIKLFNMNSNIGPGKARNWGISHVHGDYISFMDHDDFVDPKWLLNMYNKIEQEKVDCVYCAYAEFYEDTKIIENCYMTKELMKIKKLTADNRMSKLTSDNFQPWRRLIRANIFQENNVIFAEEYNRFDDVLFTQLLIDNIQSISYVNEILYFHRVHPNSIISKSMVDGNMYFDHFRTAKILENMYANDANKLRIMIMRLLPVLVDYLEFVISKKLYAKQLLFYIDKYHFGFSKKIKVIKILTKCHMIKIRRYCISSFKGFFKLHTPKMYYFLKKVFIKLPRSK